MPNHFQESDPARSQRGREFVLVPHRRAVGRSFLWMARFRRLARDDERLTGTLAGLLDVAFGLMMLRKAAPPFARSLSHAVESLRNRAPTL